MPFLILDLDLVLNKLISGTPKLGATFPTLLLMHFKFRPRLLQCKDWACRVPNRWRDGCWGILKWRNVNSFMRTLSDACTIGMREATFKNRNSLTEDCKKKNNTPTLTET